MHGEEGKEGVHLRARTGLRDTRNKVGGRTTEEEEEME